MTVHIDTTSEPGAWKRALGRGCLSEAGPICRRCGRPICDHPDPVFAGIIPANGNEPSRYGEANGFRGMQKCVVHDGKASA